MHHQEFGFVIRTTMHVLRTRCRATINEETANTNYLTGMPQLKLAKAPSSPAYAGEGLRRIDFKLDMIGLSTPPIPSTDEDLSTPAASPSASTIIDNDIACKHNAIAKSKATIHSVHVGRSIHGSSKECTRYQTSSSPPSIAEVEFIPENLFISVVFERTNTFQLQPRPSSK